ncbi:MAG: LLM class flavin-dependent oxidoreductase [Acidimicrobiia bacterium]|nr:LLM class flavin-dependent oxidoreductase [Acidimicrobiia bacterium]
MTPAVSVTAPQFTQRWDEVVEAAQLAESLGFSGLFVFDHLVPIGEPPRPVFEMAAALGAIAAGTTTLRVGTLVMRVPLRGELVSERIAATVAAIAPGRFVLGLGAGDKLSGDEARRFGLSTGSLQARVGAVDGLVASMAESQPDIPVWVGGSHPTILDVIRRRRAGWNGWGITAERFAEVAATIPGPTTWGGPVVLGRDRKEAAALVGERRSLAGDPDRVAAGLAEYLEAGAAEIVVSIIPNRPERWRFFAEEVIPRLREWSIGDR